MAEILSCAWVGHVGRTCVSEIKSGGLDVIVHGDSFNNDYGL